MGLKECQRLGHRIVIVVGHPTYYPKFGFTLARDFGIHAPFPCPDEAFMALQLESGALDGISGTVRYPLAFDAVGATHLVDGATGQNSLSAISCSTLLILGSREASGATHTGMPLYRYPQTYLTER